MLNEYLGDKMLKKAKEVSKQVDGYELRIGKMGWRSSHTDRRIHKMEMVKTSSTYIQSW